MTFASGSAVTCHTGVDKVDLPNGGATQSGLIWTTTASPASDGGVYINIRAEYTKRDPTNGTDVRIRGNTLQLIKVAKSGETIALEIPPPDNDPKIKPTRLDLTVSKVYPTFSKAKP